MYSRTKLLSAAAFTAVALFGSTTNVMALDLNNTRLPTYSDGHVTLSMSRVWPGITVLLQRDNGDATSIELPHDFQQVDHITAAPGSRVVLSGRSSPDIDEIVIIDLVKSAVVDHFWGHSAVVSPDGRWVAFSKFHPTHSVSGVEDQYRVYDVLKSPVQNRTSNTMPTSPVEAVVEVGRPIYPLAPSEIDRENFGVDAAIAHQRVSTFFWSPDSARVVFADRQAGFVSVVLASVAVGTTAVHRLSNGLAGCPTNCEHARMESALFTDLGIETKFSNSPQYSQDLHKVVATVAIKVGDFQLITSPN